MITTWQPKEATVAQEADRKLAQLAEISVLLSKTTPPKDLNNDFPYYPLDTQQKNQTFTHLPLVGDLHINIWYDKAFVYKTIVINNEQVFLHLLRPPSSKQKSNGFWGHNR